MRILAVLYLISSAYAMTRLGVSVLPPTSPFSVSYRIDETSYVFEILELYEAKINSKPLANTVYLADIATLLDTKLVLADLKWEASAEALAPVLSDPIYQRNFTAAIAHAHARHHHSDSSDISESHDTPEVRPAQMLASYISMNFSYTEVMMPPPWFSMEIYLYNYRASHFQANGLVVSFRVRRVDDKQRPRPMSQTSQAWDTTGYYCARDPKIRPVNGFLMCAKDSSFFAANDVSAELYYAVLPSAVFKNGTKTNTNRQYSDTNTNTHTDFGLGAVATTEYPGGVYWGLEIWPRI